MQMNFFDNDETSFDVNALLQDANDRDIAFDPDRRKVVYLATGRHSRDLNVIRSKICLHHMFGQLSVCPDPYGAIDHAALLKSRRLLGDGDARVDFGNRLTWIGHAC